MVAFLFRSNRTELHLVMNVGLQDIHTSRPLPGLTTTTVINLSPEGACLILPNLTINGKHLFYETLNSYDYNLLLYPKNRNGVEDECTIAAKSIWMNSCEHNQTPAFKIGIHFLHKQKEFYKRLQQHSQSSPG